MKSTDKAQNSTKNGEAKNQNNQSKEKQEKKPIETLTKLAKELQLYQEIEQAMTRIDNRPKEDRTYWNMDKTVSEFMKAFERSSGRFGYSEMFEDMLDYFLWYATMCKTDISHLQIKYTDKERENFKKLMDIVTHGMTDFSDVLGACYMEVSSRWRQKNMGQFFSPEPICEMMARMVLSKESVDKHIADKGYFTMADPSGCGSGRMLLAGARVLGEETFRKCYYVGSDLDHTCVKMTVFNMFAYSIPGIVYHENALSLQVFNIYEVNKTKMFGRYIPSVKKMPKEQLEEFYRVRNEMMFANSRAKKEQPQQQPKKENVKTIKFTDENAKAKGEKMVTTKIETPVILDTPIPKKKTKRKTNENPQQGSLF